MHRGMKTVWVLQNGKYRSVAEKQGFKGLEEWENEEMKQLELDYKIRVLNCLPKDYELWAVENHQTF